MQIWDLFQGYEKAHGQFEVKRHNEKGKAEGRAITLRGPAVQADWDQHIVGKGSGLGVIPLCDDNTILWGCIDIDVIGIDHTALEDQCKKLELPLVVARSKSGGAHLFLFFKEPAPATVARDALEGWAAALGHGGCEVFPKQVARYNETDMGNWLNMPYYDADRTVRYAVKDGKPLDLNDFVEHAEAFQITLGQLADIKVVAPDTKNKEGSPLNQGDFVDGPPCLQLLQKQGGFPEGTRNDGLYNVAVYLRKRFPDDWQDHLQRYNVLMSDPPLGLNEVNNIVKSIGRKDYEFKCKGAPINAFCHRRVCRQRSFGVGDGAEGGGRPEVGHLVKHQGDPVIWFADLDGHRLMLTTEDLLNQNIFKRKVAEAINRVFSTIPQNRWDKYIDSKMRDCDVVEVPEDASPRGQFKLLVERYLTGMAQATSRDELFTRFTPFKTEDGEMMFRSRGLLDYLSNHGYKYTSTHHVWQMLKDDLGAVNRFINVKGKGRNVWVVPAPEEPPEEGEALPEFGGEDF